MTAVGRSVSQVADVFMQLYQLTHFTCVHIKKCHCLNET